MNKWTSRLSITTLTAALALGASAVGGAPAAAVPLDNASCTGRTVSGGAQNSPGPFGGIVSEYATHYGEEWGQSISKEARTEGQWPSVTESEGCPAPFLGWHFAHVLDSA